MTGTMIYLSICIGVGVFLAMRSEGKPRWASFKEGFMAAVLWPFFLGVVFYDQVICDGGSEVKLTDAD